MKDVVEEQNVYFRIKPERVVLFLSALLVTSIIVSTVYYLMGDLGYYITGRNIAFGLVGLEVLFAMTAPMLTLEDETININITAIGTVLVFVVMLGVFGYMLYGLKSLPKEQNNGLAVIVGVIAVTFTVLFSGAHIASLKDKAKILRKGKGEMASETDS